MFKRPSEKNLTEEEMQKIFDASAKQTGSLSSPKTYDPDYPVFDTPVNQKVLIYIPNHTTIDEDGSVRIRSDLFNAHVVRVGKSYSDVRCANMVINEKLGLDGTCPLCVATQECWDLYNLQYAEIAKSKGVAIGSPEEEELLKEDRKKLTANMAIKASEKWITFPIVVIDCVEGKTIPKKDATGKITGKPMFYSIRQTTYDDKWKKAFDALEEDDGDIGGDNPAGRWAVLNFTYTPKTGTHNKRDSAKALNVAFRKMEGYGEWEKYFDNLTESWTPGLMTRKLVRNAIRNIEELNEVAEEIIKPVRDKLAQYEVAGMIQDKGDVVTDADSTLQNFGADLISEGESDSGDGEMPKL